MKRLIILTLLAGCAAEPEVVAVAPIAPEPVVEPRRQFTDDNIPYDLTAGADLSAIPPDWIEVFCTQPWESRAEPFTGIEQWNPCLRPDMFADGPRAVEQVTIAEPAAAPEALATADPLASVRAVLAEPQVVPEPVEPASVVARQAEFDIPPDPTLFLNPDGSFSRRAQ